MKKIFTKMMLWAVAATAIVSCENNFNDTTVNGDTNLVKVTLTADKPTVVSENRTELDNEGQPLWSVGDQIGVYTTQEKDATIYPFTNDNEIKATATTTFTGNTALANTLYVYYPCGDKILDNGARGTISATQQPTATSFDGASDIMIAKPVTLDAEGNQLSNLEFARVGAIVKVVLKDKTGNLANQHLSTLTMTAATDLAGYVYLDVENQELGDLYSNESQSVTANYTPATTYEIDGTNATYIVVYPQILASGSKLTFNAQTEGYTITKEITLSQDIDLAMGKVTTLNVSLDTANVEKIDTIEWVNNAYNLVPNITGLAVGDKVVIAAAGYNVAMGEQKSNNRAAVAITKNTNNTIDIDSSVEVLTVEAGNVDGTFAFKTSDNKYLYAASSDSNHLKSEATLSDNSSFLVTITDGIASVVAQGTNTRNTMQYNNSNSIFACYGSASQGAISIYKLVGEYVVKAPAITLSVANVTINADITSGEATVTAENDEDWAINATTDATWVSNLAYADGKITFTTETNEDEEKDRTATVTVTATKTDYEDVTTTFTITQNKKQTAGGPVEVTDVLNYAFTGISGTSYATWSGKKGESNAVYAGQSGGQHSSIQLRTTNNNSGIVTTTSGGKVAKIVVSWNSNTASGRILQIYGKNTAYSAATDLYDSSKQGTKLGEIKYGTSTELTISGDYAYIGMRSSNNAMYLDEIQITWVTGEGDNTGGGETPDPTPDPDPEPGTGGGDEPEQGGDEPVVVLSEQFDNNSASDSSSAITTSTFPNFSGATDKAYKGKYGSLKLGSSKAEGYITTKLLDLSSTFTVQIDACKYSSETGNIVVTCGSQTQTINNSELGAEGSFKTFTLTFSAATATSTVKIATSSKRAYIDNVIITRN